MARKISMSQIRNKVRQAQNKQKQAIAKYNRGVRQYTQRVNRAVNQYKAEVRKHNARVRANRQKIVTELRKIQSQSRSVTVRYQTVRTSAISLNTYYENLNAREQEFENINYGASFLDLSEKENANSLEVSNTLEAKEGAETSTVDPALLLKTEIADNLASISPELNNRWKGALYSLNPKNPDAARHFCTSAREVFVQILEIHAPDSHVLENNPNCNKTDSGSPTHRSKIEFMLQKAGIINDAAVDFVDADVKNVLSLFRVFNDGTHGSSGRFGVDELMAIKIRVEDGITYLSSICQAA